MNPLPSLPLVLFSGLAADATLVMPQKLAFPQLIIPPWIAPAENEPLAAYCERFAESIRPLGQCVIGGVSFGGVIAMEMARFLDPAAVLLIGSIRGPNQLPRRLAVFRCLQRFTPHFPVWAVRWSATVVAALTGKNFFPNISAIARQYRHVDTQLFRWSIQQGLAWTEQPEVDCPVYQVHGDRDRVLPIKYMRPDTVVHGAGHLISMTHCDQVNDFIRTCLGRIATPAEVAKTAGHSMFDDHSHQAISRSPQ